MASGIMIRLKETKYHQERLEREVVRGGGEEELEGVQCIKEKLCV
jgi:hypothetical protein